MGRGAAERVIRRRPTALRRPAANTAPLLIFTVISGKSELRPDQALPLRVTDGGSFIEEGLCYVGAGTVAWLARQGYHILRTRHQAVIVDLNAGHRDLRLISVRIEEVI